MKNKNITPDKNEVTIISAGVVIEGKVSSSGNIRIDGIINGDVNAQGNITVGEHGQIKGQINADNVVVGGKIFGTVNAKEKFVLESDSILNGDVITKILVISPGARFNGNSKMTGNETQNSSD